MKDKIDSAVSRFGMDRAYKKVIIGFSGGADSSALLHYFSKRSEKIVAIHINHMIRGEEAVRDEEFCKRVCSEYGIEFVCHKIDIPRLAKERSMGIEQTARDERYRVFLDELQKRNFDAILTAHNANDNVESVIFNLVRGSGANGICGIKPVNENVLRPLIYATRKEIISYCLDNNIEYVEDSTNAQTDYTRNYIRHIVVPALKKINPSIDESVSRLCTTLREDEEYISKKCEEFILQYCGDKKIPVNKIIECEDAISARVFKNLSGVNLDYKSISSCKKFIKSSNCSDVINLCCGVSLKREKEYIYFIKTKELEKIDFFEKPLEKITEVFEIGEVITKNTEIPYKEPYCIVALNENFINGKLVVRSRKDGDTIFQGNMTKKLKKIFCEKKIPSHMRDKIPIICDEAGIVAVPNVVIRDGINKNDKNLILRFYK